MSDTSRGSRTLTTLSDGAKWSIIAGIPLLALALFFFFTPISLPQATGGYFYCGSAASPNADATQVCEPVERANRTKAMASLGAGLAVPLAGLGLFGVTRRSQTQRPDADDDAFDGSRGGRRPAHDLLDDEDETRLDTPASRRSAVERGRTRSEDPEDADDLDEFDDQPRARRRSDDWADEGRR